MTLSERLENMLSRVSNKYDTSPGSFLYDLLYPVAEQFQMRADKAEKIQNNTLAVSAKDFYLDWKVEEQSVYRKQATFAKGIVRIYGARGAAVRQGAKMAADNILFAVDRPATIPESGYVDVSATCLMAGKRGNVDAGAINRFPLTLPELTAVINNAPFTGGYDAETDEDLRTRYFDKVTHPIASGNKYQYEAWAKEVTGVGDAKCIPTWNGPGTVKIVIVDENNQPATEELVQAVYEHIEEVRTVAEAEVTVVSAEGITIDVSVGLIYAYEDVSESDIINSIKASLTEYFANTSLEKNYISYMGVGSIILKISGVEDCTSLKLNNSTDNIEIPTGYIPVLGEVTII